MKPSANAVALLLLLLLLSTTGRCAGRPAAVREPNAERSVVEVAEGDTAVLRCPSNDEHHRFQFWWMRPDRIIGPGTALNTDKFRYEVLTGTLYIKVGARDGAVRFPNGLIPTRAYDVVDNDFIKVAVIRTRNH